MLSILKNQTKNMPSKKNEEQSVNNIKINTENEKTTGKKTGRKKTNSRKDEEITKTDIKVDLASANKKNENLPGIYKKITGLVVIIIIILAGLIIHFSFAKALIYIDPEYSKHAISFSAQIVDPDSPDLADQNDALVGRKLNTVIVEKQAFPATTKTRTGEKAGGQVTLINKYNKDQTLVATTRLLTPDQKLFRLTDLVIIPAGGTINANVEADQAGDEFLIGPSSFSIPGLWEGLRDKIYAESNQAMTYQTITDNTITTEDMDNAYKVIRKKILEQAMENFAKDLTPNEYINKDALIVEEVRISPSAQVGDKVENFDLELELLISTITYDEQKLLAKIENDINVLSQQNQGMIKFSNDNISISIKEDDNKDNKIIGLIQGKYTVQLANPNIDLEQLKGLNKEAALTYLNELSGIKNASIQLRPFWLKSIPTLDNHIEIILNK